MNNFKTMKAFLYCCFFLTSCSTGIKIAVPSSPGGLSGSAFYAKAAAMGWQARDSLALLEILRGNIPSFLKHFYPVRTGYRDSLTGKEFEAVFYVAPDYLSLGSDADWARVNLTPRAAQRIADSFGCFLPTRKMVDDIYRSATVKLEPMPLFALRDSSPTMYHHHLIIEGQRKQRKGLIAGIKKDIVLSGRLSENGKADRVAIYGWHRTDGKPIQPLYTGHVYWWVDYSQSVRLVYRRIKVNGKWMDYKDILADPMLNRLICDEQYCDFYKYPY
ncbi:MAG TPA: hypothetical protein VFR58_16950 [Flavisolibacter sp.]|nr:hypothetical protein [Flavisolibacter sp.]